VLAGILFHLPAGLAVGVAGLVVAAVRSSNDGALPCYASFRGRGRGRLPRRRFAEQLIGGLVAGSLIGLAAWESPSVVTGATPLFAITALTLATRTKTPLRLIRFLDDAHQLGILRQVGAVYQFRHAQLQDHLAATYRRRGGQT
jgi:hypothetical protein